MNIARILTYFDKTPDLGVRTLQKFLGEKDPDVRSAIIDALGDLRKSSSIPLIAKQLNDQHSTVRSAAIGSLLRFGSESYLIAPVIIKSMRANRGDADFLGTAALCLGTIGHRAIPAIDAEIMNRENPVVLREYFLDALGNMGAYGNSDKAVLAIPTLTKAINAVEPEIRCRALSSLWAICRSSKNIDPDKDLNAILQIGAIKKRPANERLLVASIAALFKKYRVVAIPVFDEALRSRDATLVQRALANCILLEEDMGALSFAMIYVMNHAADAIKLSAIEAVGGDPRFIVALPTLLRIIAGDKDPACRRAAMAAAGRASLSILTIVARRIVFL